jgi:hypothetical protein
MGLRTFEALLSRPENVARVEAERRAIERAGCMLRVSPPDRTGMILVELTLPEPYLPDDFLPRLPFYPA